MITDPICPECRNGKHPNCDQIDLDEKSESFVQCYCLAKNHQ